MDEIKREFVAVMTYREYVNLKNMDPTQKDPGFLNKLGFLVRYYFNQNRMEWGFKFVDEFLDETYNEVDNQFEDNSFDFNIAYKLMTKGIIVSEIDIPHIGYVIGSQWIVRGDDLENTSKQHITNDGIMSCDVSGETVTYFDFEDCFEPYAITKKWILSKVDYKG